MEGQACEKIRKERIGFSWAELGAGLRGKREAAIKNQVGVELATPSCTGDVTRK